MIINIGIWIIYSLNTLLAIVVFGIALKAASKINFVGQFTSRSERYRKTGFELGCMESIYRLFTAALFALIVMIPSILIYDSRSDDINLKSFFEPEPKRATPSQEEILESLNKATGLSTEEPSKNKNN